MFEKNRIEKNYINFYFTYKLLCDCLGDNSYSKNIYYYYNDKTRLFKYIQDD